MDNKDKKITGFNVDISEVDGKTGFTGNVYMKPKKASLSKRAGWIPGDYCEPEKFTATSVEKLISKIREILKNCKDVEK